VNPLKLIGLAFIQTVKRIWALPKTVADAGKQRRHRSILRKLEVERLDRIRHPENYRGR